MHLVDTLCECCLDSNALFYQKGTLSTNIHWCSGCLLSTYIIPSMNVLRFGQGPNCDSTVPCLPSFVQRGISFAQTSGSSETNYRSVGVWVELVYRLGPISQLRSHKRIPATAGTFAAVLCPNQDLCRKSVTSLCDILSDDGIIETTAEMKDCDAVYRFLDGMTLYPRWIETAKEARALFAGIAVLLPHQAVNETHTEI